MDNKLLIVGVDPGTTLGYAVLDIKGKVVKVRSSKQLKLSSLISEVINLGRVIVVGTDKAKVPGFVQLFSVKTGGKVVRPKEDLKVSEKRRLVFEHNVRNDHETDALASALFAYKEIDGLLKKIEVFVERNNKSSIKDKIIELVIAKDISIKHAVDIIEKPEKKEVKIIKRVVEERKLNQADFLKLYNKVKRYEKETLFLKKQNISLKQELNKVFEKYKYIAKKVDKLRSDEKTEELIGFKEKRIKFFGNEVKEKNEKIDLLFGKINNLNFILSNLNKDYLLKKLNNLGSLEFENKNRFLNIGKGDTLLVDDANVFNSKIIEKLKDKVKIIVYKKKLNNSTRRLPFVSINGGNLDLTEAKHFAIVSKKELDKEVSKSNILDRVVEDYKTKRITDLDN